MKIHILSDLHSEFEDYEYVETDSDVVILAGDTNIKTRGATWALDTIRNKPIIYVLGNHEYYTAAYPKLLNAIKDLCKDTNLSVLENERIVVNDVNFLGCTLWTDFKLFDNPRLTGYECQQVMTDYKKIRLSPKFSKLRSIDVAAINQRSSRWLKAELNSLATSKSVVVTHHAPSIQSVPEHLRDDSISAAYASNYEDLINSYNPDLWVHGHIHVSSDYYLHQTRVVCNPRGYPDEPNHDFKKDYVLEI